VQKGLRKRNSPMCTLSQNGYGDCLCRPSAIALSRSRRKAQAKKKPQERDGGRQAKERRRRASTRCGLVARNCWQLPKRQPNMSHASSIGLAASLGTPPPHLTPPHPAQSRFGLT